MDQQVRVLVCGGRDYGVHAFLQEAHLFDVLDEFHRRHSVDMLCTGAAQGADLLAERWAKSRELPYVGYPAQWLTCGKAAGPIRNQQMLDEFKPDYVIAFPGGRGTAHMVSIARKAGVPVLEVILAQ